MKAILKALAAVLVLLSLAAYFLLKIYISTPWAASQASRLLSRQLGLPTTVSQIAMDGGSIHAYGITIANPAGFKGAPLLVIHRIDVAPDWVALIGGSRNFRSIALSGLHLSLARDGRGHWNFAPLLRRPPARKPAREVRIAALRIEEGELSVDRVPFRRISLDLRDLATKGSAESRLNLGFRDANGNPFQVDGTARSGDSPSLDLKIHSPSYALRSLASRLKSPRLKIDRGMAELFLQLKLQDGMLHFAGKASGKDVQFQEGTEAIPIAASLSFAGSYHLRRDVARLEQCLLSVNNLVRLQAAVTMEKVRSLRSFTADISASPIPLAEVTLLQRKDTSVRGVVSLPGVHLAGDRSGISAGSGSLVLRDIAVTRRDRLLASGVNGDILLEREGDGWRIGGKLATARSGGKPMLERLEARLASRFTERFRLISAGVSSLKAAINGIPLEGRLLYRPDAVVPLNGKLIVPETPLRVLRPYLQRDGMEIASGTIALNAVFSGSHPVRDIRCESGITLRNLGGTLNGHSVTLKEGRLTGRMGKKGDNLTGEANIQGSGGTFDSTPFDAVSDLHILNRQVSAGKGKIRFGKAGVGFDELHGELPQITQSAEGRRVPLNFAGKGISVSMPNVALYDIAGTLSTALLTDGKARRLDGSGAFTASLFLGEKKAGTLSCRLECGREGVRAEIGGKVADGSVTSLVQVDPFSPQRKVTFSADLKQLRANILVHAAPGRSGERVTDGRITMAFSGSHARETGLNVSGEAAVEGVALKVREGRSLQGVNGGAKIAYRNAALRIADGRMSAPGGLSAIFSGEIADVATAGRKGSMAVSIAPARIESLLDAYVNLLPRFLQEAEGAGSVEATGALRLQGKKALLEGVLSLAEGRLVNSSQKLSISNVAGRMPFSFDLSGEEGRRPDKMPPFSRENYDRLRGMLRSSRPEGEQFVIEKLRFGPLLVENIRLTGRAGDGVLELAALDAELYQGRLTGRGHLLAGKPFEYGADLLLDSLSLREFCNAFPNIKGYLTGKMDGVVSILGKGKGVEGITGFVELWTRSTKDEKMLVSREFLQKLAGKKLRGFFFRDDRPYDRGDISAYLENGYLTFQKLDISHTNLFGHRDLSVTVAPVQNRIALMHLVEAVREAAARGKAVKGEEEKGVEPKFDWLEK
ncbi:MAG: hypothetical protein HYS23_14505 [Geobacter sp.]|nr:hypothetical protein [Geobacter sp.]